MSFIFSAHPCQRLCLAAAHGDVQGKVLEGRANTIQRLDHLACRMCDWFWEGNMGIHYLEFPQGLYSLLGTYELRELRLLWSAPRAST